MRSASDFVGDDMTGMGLRPQWLMVVPPVVKKYVVDFEDLCAAERVHFNLLHSSRATNFNARDIRVLIPPPASVELNPLEAIFREFKLHTLCDPVEAKAHMQGQSPLEVAGLLSAIMDDVSKHMHDHLDRVLLNADSHNI
jgi:hypothetical protein